MVKLAACLLSCFVLAACATRRDNPPSDPASARSGIVGFQDISGLTSAPGGRLSLAENESYLEPLEAVGSQMPPYPAQLLGTPLAAQPVCVSVAISAQGSILSSHGLVEGSTCPEPADIAFLQSVRETLASWTFEPARRCIFPSAAAKEMAIASCNGGQEVPISVTLTYRFVFEQHDGKGTVRLGL